MALTESAQRWMLWAGVVVVILGLRVGCVLYDRSRPFSQKAVTERPIEHDRLVVVPKFYVQDFATAQQLSGKTLWVKLGYATGYFPDNRRVKPASRELKYFQPLESFTIEGVTERPMVGEPGNKEVLLRFQKDGHPYVTSVGVFDVRAERYEMQLDELFYLRNPRELYTHWHKDTWSKIERHCLENGMTVTQAFLSIGFGRLVTTEAGGIQLYEFARKPGGEPGRTRVRFLDGRVKEFEVVP